jgi:hypothetical protein
MTRLPFSRAELAAVISVAACLLVIASPAAAESFFQKLFGFGGNAQPAPVAKSAATVQIPAYRFQSRPRQYLRTEPVEQHDDAGGPPDSEGPFQTMCVRTCDGFYFPVRYNAKKKHFGHDAEACRASCGENARLFVYSTRGGSPDTMRDLSGRRYTDLETAFAFRTSISSACRCQPEPWSPEANARHDEYARIEAEERAKTEAEDRAKDIAAVRSKDVYGPPAPEKLTAEAPSETYEPIANAKAETLKAIAVAPMGLTASKPKLEKQAKAAKAARVVKTTASAPQQQQPQSQKPSSGFAGLFSGGGKYVYPGDPQPTVRR